MWTMSKNLSALLSNKNLLIHFFLHIIIKNSDSKNKIDSAYFEEYL